MKLRQSAVDTVDVEGGDFFNHALVGASNHPWLRPFILKGETLRDVKFGQARQEPTNARRDWSSKSTRKDVKSAMQKRKEGTLKSGKSGKTVKSKKQAIAIGLSEARAKGKKVPKKKGA